MRWLATFLSTLLFPTLAAAESFTGKVVGVSDGDTITVLRDKRPVKILLHGVDCPEKNQPYGMKAKQLTSKACGPALPGRQRLCLDAPLCVCVFPMQPRGELGRQPRRPLH